MSATKLLEQVKSLSARERHKFVRAVLALEENSPARAKKASKRVKWPNVEERAKRICGGRALPNMVLLEREESPY